MKRFLVFSLVSQIFASHLFSQVDPKIPVKNLVPNGSFENYRRKSSDIRKAIPWRQIETIDYYHNPLANDTTAEKGARTGAAYAGFRFRKKYREFLQVKLTDPLKRGVVYELRMHVRLAFWSNVILRSFGGYFSKSGYRDNGDVQRSYMVDTLCSAGGLHNDYRWITITGYYKAAGGEKYLTIGNFAPVLKKDMVNINVFRFGPRESYYFLDDVSLTRAAQFEEKVAVERVGPDYLQLWQDSALKVKENITVGETVSLNNIFFENGRYYLLPESYRELDRLARYLMANPALEIRINGHSDNTGLSFKNQKMSELRAREVFEYLINKGVQNKMHFKGFGSSRPVADNATDEGRARNRRVEFEIIKK